MFRFSLRTLVVMTLWVGAVMAVWARREPWTLGQQFIPEREALGGNWYVVQVWDSRQVRVVTNPNLPSRIEITEVPSGRSLYSLSVDAKIHGVRFRGADEIEIVSGVDIFSRLSRLTRHYPEWWWGHFYRLEVWLLMVLSLTLVVTFVRRVRARRAPRV